MVLPPIAPRSYSPRAVSSNSLRSLRFAISYLLQFARIGQPVDRVLVKSQIGLRQQLQAAQFVVVQVVPLVLREAVQKNPAVPQIGRKHRTPSAALAATRPRDTLLDQAGAAVGLHQTCPHLLDRSPKCGIRHAFLASPSGKRLGLEYAHRSEERRVGKECRS